MVHDLILSPRIYSNLLLDLEFGGQLTFPLYQYTARESVIYKTQITMLPPFDYFEHRRAW